LVKKLAIAKPHSAGLGTNEVLMMGTNSSNYALDMPMLEAGF